jgi:hypothetical protein
MVVCCINASADLTIGANCFADVLGGRRFVFVVLVDSTLSVEFGLIVGMQVCKK